MRKEAGALLTAGCIATLLAIGAIGTATAAIVPFNGTEYSWLHDGGGDWITQINGTISVRPGDSMLSTTFFRRADPEKETSGNPEDPGPDEFASATNMPAFTARPPAADIPVVTVQPTDAGILASGETPLSTAGFRFDAVMLVSGALAITCLYRGWLRR